jgi:L-ascorbate metabolism protein UlaG (beta-lactamase superfamily)
MRTLAIALIVLAAAALAPGPGTVQASPCHAFVQTNPDVRLIRAGLQRANAGSEVAIRFVGHSTFRIRTPGDVIIATDYAGNAGAGPVPDVVTMNHAHHTHYTRSPNPKIDHVLRGWNPTGEGPAKHDLTVGDVRIRNVPTNIRGIGNTVEPDGNSIFVFESADLCIAHLGHLHHKLTDRDRALLGRVDVVFAPVDGIYTLNLSEMTDVLTRLGASLVLPMHVFSGRSLRRFLAGARSAFNVRMAAESPITVSRRTLPREPTILVPKRLAAQR